MSASSRLGGTLEVLEDRSERQYKKHEKHDQKNTTHDKNMTTNNFLGIRENLVIFAIRLSPLVRAPRI